MTATLHGESHDPTVGRLWSYSVEAVDAQNQALSGTVATEFLYAGRVVGHESPATHSLTNGRLDDEITFPAESLEIPLTLQCVVTTPLGTLALDWPVKSRP
jgi:hypothetical protein